MICPMYIGNILYRHIHRTNYGLNQSFLTAGPPNKFQHYTTIQNCAFYYNPLGHARSILFSLANRQVHVVCAADSLSFAFLVKTNVAGEMNLAHNLSFTTSCCSSRLSRNRKWYYFADRTINKNCMTDRRK